MTLHEYAGLLCYNSNSLSKPRLAPKKAEPKGPGLSLGSLDLERKNGSWGGMYDQTLPLPLRTQTSNPQPPAGHQQILGGVRFVLLRAVHSRLPGETVRQELPLWKMYQRILHLRSRMGRRPVPALPGEVQVSGRGVHRSLKINVRLLCSLICAQRVSWCSLWKCSTPPKNGLMQQ